jgi:hypothetical protein
MTLAFPKPAKPTRDRPYMGWVAMLPCVCCRRYGVQVHHPIHGRFAQRKASDNETIPLCPQHHDELHHSPDAWKALFGLDTDYIEQTRKAVAQMRQNIIGGRT